MLIEPVQGVVPPAHVGDYELGAVDRHRLQLPGRRQAGGRAEDGQLGRRAPGACAPSGVDKIDYLPVSRKGIRHAACGQPDVTGWGARRKR